MPRIRGLSAYLGALLSTGWGSAAIVLMLAAAIGTRIEGIHNSFPVALASAAVVAIVIAGQRLFIRERTAASTERAAAAAERAAAAEERASRVAIQTQFDTHVPWLTAQITELRRPKVGADVQVLLRMQYRELLRSGSPLPPLHDVEFRCRSQNGEDGILLYIFSLIGTTNRRVVEIGVGDGLECNAANLVINHGWRGLLIDGDGERIAAGRSYYSTFPDTWVEPPVLKDAWISRDNVNAVVAAEGFAGPIDLLSLDIDGNDYWIWEALTCIEPRVVVLEFNHLCGPDRRVSMSYRADYRLDLTKRPYRHGASLPAFVELGKRKGYRLIGVQTLGFNAFFVRDGIAEDLLPECSAKACYEHNEVLRRWTPGELEAILSGPEPWEELS